MISKQPKICYNATRENMYKHKVPCKMDREEMDKS